MAYWLVKTEPNEYSYADLEKLGRDRWNGVRNFVALKHLRQMQPDDLVFVYHTGEEKAVVGVAEVAAAAYPDPAEQDPRYVVVDLIPRYRLERPVSLKEIKAEPRFGEWELVRQARLSVMPVSQAHWQLVRHLATT
ncbi:MAG: EVE domain-containing protein [Negativicutes bacterium]|nr:EVE domain-containing protein [Negativicutes bacterium]